MTLEFGPIPTDATERLRQHVECCEKRDACASRAMELLAGDNLRAGIEARDEAELWALRAAELEPSSGVERRKTRDVFTC
jgi:hypothetical protein